MDDETRRRYIIAGVLVGAVTAGLVVLARTTPRDKWGSTLLRIARDGVSVLKGRLGGDDGVRLVEVALNRMEEASAGNKTAMALAFSKAAAGKPHIV